MIDIVQMKTPQLMPELHARIDRLNDIGVALSAESDTDKLLEVIMMGAKSLTHADGGSLYFFKDGVLTFEIISTDSLGVHMGGTTDNKITFPPIEMMKDGEENHSNVVSHCVLSGKTINIEDAYHEDGFDFSGTQKFDRQTGYRTKSILTFPLKDHHKEIIGVLQLINAKDIQTGETISFNSIDQQLAESLASQAAVALTQRRLISELENLFESFVKMIANAIDDKSPYTGGHCRRVPVLTMMLADAVHNEDDGPLGTFRINDNDRYELETAAWLHDCGKVVVPEYIMDKSTKLETVHDRIHGIELKVEILLRDAEISWLRARFEADGSEKIIADHKRDYDDKSRKYREALAFLQKANVGGEFVTDEDLAHLTELAKISWIDRDGKVGTLVNADELKNLSIQRGTLNDEEREIVNSHIVATIRMLESLPFPKNLQNVPEFAGGHHERMDGSGYPKGLLRDQMSVQARIMAVADIFEALVAGDRPYKKGKKLSECLKIMGYMKLDHHIDPDIFDIFIKNKVYLDYAQEFVDSSQIDEVDIAAIPGYVPESDLEVS